MLVKTEKASGSGSVIYSKPDENKPSDYATFVLTNWHVIENAIEVNDEYDPRVGKEIKRETRSTVMVEFYEYHNLSQLIGRKAVAADVLAYHKHRDIALLRLRSPKPAEHVAELYPKDKLDDIHIFDELICIGCALGHKPVITMGYLASRGDEDDEIENHIYWLSTAGSCFGNSGGAIYRSKDLRFIGIPSRIGVVLLGFSANAIPHLSWFIPITEIFKWLDDECYQFLYDPAYTQKQCEELRRQKIEELKGLHSKTDAKVMLTDDKEAYPST